MTALLISAACLFEVMFAHKAVNGQLHGGHGGGVGNLFGGITLNALDKIPASLLFFITTFLLFFLTFNISLKILLKPFQRNKDKDTDLEDLKQKATDNGFKLNEGVPVEHHDGKDKEQPRLSTFRNSAQKLTATESHDALTLASDPN